jgi:hypothetical protein
MGSKNLSAIILNAPGYIFTEIVNGAGAKAAVMQPEPNSNPINSPNCTFAKTDFPFLVVYHFVADTQLEKKQSNSDFGIIQKQFSSGERYSM